MAITTDIDRFRLELGDTPKAYGLSMPRPVPDPEFDDACLLNDDEIEYFLAQRPGNVLLAVADACDSLARRFAREFDFDANDEKSFKRSQKATAYRAMAKDLRQRATAGGGLSAVVVTKADAIADDLSSRDADVSNPDTGRVRHGYYNSDLPR